MNIPKALSTQAGAALLIIFAIILAIAGLHAQTPTPSVTSTPTPVPDTFKKIMIQAFTNSLTRAAKSSEGTFRTNLYLPDSAKSAVEKELQQLQGQQQTKIPDNWIIVFYEPLPPAKRTSPVKFIPNPQNDSYHVFYLPPVDDKPHTYDLHLMCCYDPWQP